MISIPNLVGGAYPCYVFILILMPLCVDEDDIYTD